MRKNFCGGLMSLVSFAHVFFNFTHFFPDFRHHFDWLQTTLHFKALPSHGRLKVLVSSWGCEFCCSLQVYGIFLWFEAIKGSATLYRALHKRCLERELFILARYTQKVNTAPKLVAIVPQASECKNVCPLQLSSNFSSKFISICV